MEDLLGVALRGGVRTCLRNTMSDHSIRHSHRSEDGSDGCFIVHTTSPVSGPQARAGSSRQVENWEPKRCGL